MSVTIDWGTRVISIERNNLTLVQSSPTEIRELNVNWFRLQLKDLEGSEAGMPHPDTHRHNTEVTLGSLTFARVVEIINDYTVTFEDGQYAVNIVGGNSNIGDRVNVNNVSVRSANSAGLISSPDIEYASFNGGVIVDVNSGISGTVYPRGTVRMKVDNIADALTIANYRGFNKIYLYSDITLGSDAKLDNFILEGQSHINIHVNILPAAEVENTIIAECEVSGTLDGGNSFKNCIVGTINYMNGHIHDSALTGTVYLSGNKDAYIVNCSMSKWGNTPTIDMGNAGQNLIMIQFTGQVKIENMHSTNKIGIGLAGGQVILNSNTVDNGMVHVSGIGKLLDESGNYIPSGSWNGVTIINELMSEDTVADAVWITDNGVITRNNIVDIRNLLEADEEFTPVKAIKRHKDTKIILLEKDVSGGSLTDTIKIDQ